MFSLDFVLFLRTFYYSIFCNSRSILVQVPYAVAWFVFSLNFIRNFLCLVFTFFLRLGQCINWFVVTATVFIACLCLHVCCCNIFAIFHQARNGICICIFVWVCAPPTPTLRSPPPPPRHSLYVYLDLSILGVIVFHGL